MPELDWTDMPIHEAIKADWKSPELLIEGSLGCAKTTVCLDKEIDALLKWPGIPILLFRWSQDAVDTKLRPAFEELLGIRGITASWDGKKNRYTLENGSVAYLFGLKAVSVVEQFNKIRGLGVSRIAGDQVEEVAQAVAGELRGRLRPDLTATMAGKRYPFQLTFVANPSDADFYLSKEFPEDNHIKGRKLYSLSIFDNKHLPEESRDSLLRTYPLEHPKHLTMVMGRRGPNITGVPVFEDQYDRKIHRRALAADLRVPFFESFEFGKHNPVYVYGQQTYSGGLNLLGGIRSLETSLDDFLPLVREFRAERIPVGSKMLTCTSPQGEKDGSAKSRFTSLDILRRAGFKASYRDNGNAPDVRLALIESLTAYLHKTINGEPALGISDDPEDWLVCSREGVTESQFLHIAFEAGYTWDKHFVSVSNKELRQPQEDDKFANAMHCVENILLNFCSGPSAAERADRLALSQLRARQYRHPSMRSKGSWMI